jgi:ComF family protein
MGKLFALVLKVFIEAIFPGKCLVCRTFLQNSGRDTDLADKFSREFLSGVENEKIFFHMLMTPFLCTACSDRFFPVRPPVCLKCGIMFKSREGENHVCGECLSSPMKYRIARASGIYDGVFRDLVHKLKYKGKTGLSKPLGFLLLKAFLTYWEKHEIDLIVPVPLHIERFRKRGFNQAFLLIRDWVTMASAMKVELPCMEIDFDVLKRSKKTAPQIGLGRRARQKNLNGAFHITNPEKITGKRILLIDDVLTTGTTANECSKALLNTGALHVDVLTLARVM